MIGLHHIDTCTCWVVRVLDLITELGGVDSIEAGNAATVDLRDVDIVADGSASDEWRIVISCGVLEEDRVVGKHCDGFIFSFDGRPVL